MDYEIAKGREDRPKRRKSRKDRKATYVDMRPTKADKEAVDALLNKWEEIWELVGEAIKSERFEVRLRWEVAQECWCVRVNDCERSYPDIVYYMFRHRDLPKVLGYVLYIMRDIWLGLLPREDILKEELEW